MTPQTGFAWKQHKRLALLELLVAVAFDANDVASWLPDVLGCLVCRRPVGRRPGVRTRPSVAAHVSVQHGAWRPPPWMGGSAWRTQEEGATLVPAAGSETEADVGYLASR